jgi:chromosome partitioning protein
MNRRGTDGELGWPAPQPGAASGPAALGWPPAAAVSRETWQVPREDANRVNVSRETDGWSGASNPLDVSRETHRPTAPGYATRSDLDPLSAPLSELVPGETTPLDDTPLEDSGGADGGAWIGGAQPLAPAEPVPPQAWPRPSERRMYTVANQKGGVGKTTSTVNLAAALAQHGARVLVVDLDPQGNTSTAFAVEHRAGTPSIYDVLIHGRPLEEVAKPVADLPGLDCVPATIDLAGAEIELVSVVARESRMRKALDALQTPYDYIFVDCPPSLGLLTVNALVAGREVLIPIQCEFYALEGLSQLLRNIELVRSHLNPELHVSTILLTMYDARTRLAEQVAAEVRNHFGGMVLDAAIPRSVRISEAPGYGQSVMTYDPVSRGAQAYARAAHELAQRAAQPSEAGQR